LIKQNKTKTKTKENKKKVGLLGAATARASAKDCKEKRRKLGETRQKRRAAAAESWAYI
jgi:hypothetical protein